MDYKEEQRKTREKLKETKLVDEYKFNLDKNRAARRTSANKEDWRLTGKNDQTYVKKDVLV